MEKAAESGGVAPAECGFPAWFGNPGELPENDVGCPVSESAMSQYMENNHLRYCLEEKPTTFSGFVLRESFIFPNRKFWIWSCEDRQRRTWDIIVGQGMSPFFEKTHERVWMHGERNSVRRSPRDLLLREYPEHINASGKAN